MKSLHGVNAMIALGLMLSSTVGTFADSTPASPLKGDVKVEKTEDGATVETKTIDKKYCVDWMSAVYVQTEKQAYAFDYHAVFNDGTEQEVKYEKSWNESHPSFLDADYGAGLEALTVIYKGPRVAIRNSKNKKEAQATCERERTKILSTKMCPGARDWDKKPKRETSSPKR